jgi:putative DNA primase/helicase
LEQCEDELFIPPLPRLYYEDVTLEALAYEVATGWPSAALVSDEAGLVVGGRGMADESALGFLALLNRLWDGRPFLPLRKQVKAAEIRGRRFSCSLMLQPELLEKIVEKGGRGVGFFGRYLLTAPPSTMGTRFYSPPPERMPALSRFGERVRELLNLELPLNDRFQLVPPVMLADRSARDAWIQYHDAVEAELGDFGEFAMIKDVAAKSAENAARIAGGFQVFDQGAGGELKQRYMEAGIAVAAWHATEANRIFFDTDKPREQQDAELLSTWLMDVAPTLTRKDGTPLIQNGCIPKWEIGRVGPNQLRKEKDRRNQALLELADDGVHHVREAKDGKKVLLEINPKLLNRWAL